MREGARSQTDSQERLSLRHSYSSYLYTDFRASSGDALTPWLKRLREKGRDRRGPSRHPNFDNSGRILLVPVENSAREAIRGQNPCISNDNSLLRYFISRSSFSLCMQRNFSTRDEKERKKERKAYDSNKAMNSIHILFPWPKTFWAISLKWHVYAAVNNRIYFLNF